MELCDYLTKACYEIKEVLDEEKVRLGQPILNDLEIVMVNLKAYAGRLSDNDRTKSLGNTLSMKIDKFYGPFSNLKTILKKEEDIIANERDLITSCINNPDHLKKLNDVFDYALKLNLSYSFEDMLKTEKPVKRKLPKAGTESYQIA